MNPLNMIKGMMGISNPKDMVMKMLSQNNNPIFKNLIDMANRGDTKEAIICLCLLIFLYLVLPL